VHLTTSLLNSYSLDVIAKEGQHAVMPMKDCVSLPRTFHFRGSKTSTKRLRGMCEAWQCQFSIHRSGVHVLGNCTTQPNSLSACSLTATNDKFRQ
jgi:hypothetical protein